MKEKIKVAYTEKYDYANERLFSEADLALLGGKSFPTINFKRELNGTDDSVVKILAISKRIKVPLVVALKTDNYGSVRRSVAIFEKGRLLSLSDANCANQGESPSIGYKVTKTSLCKIGVAVSKDVKNLDCIKALTLCESDVIINLYVDLYDFGMQTLVPTISYLFGVPLISCGAHGVIATTASGKIDFSTETGVASFTLNAKKSVKEVTVKTFSNY